MAFIMEDIIESKRRFRYSDGRAEKQPFIFTCHASSDKSYLKKKDE